MNSDKKNNYIPTIGVLEPNSGSLPSWFFISRLVKFSGGKPVKITPNNPHLDTEFQGFIFSGGANVDKSSFDSRQFSDYRSMTNILRSFKELLIYPHQWISSLINTHNTDSERDKLEKLYLEKAHNKMIPTLCICRGHQLLNLFFKGVNYTNTREIYRDNPVIRTIFPRKKVLLESRSKLHALMEKKTVYVNALHVQGVKEVSEKIIISAREENGLIQGMETTDDWPLLSVQWHPEYLFYLKNQRALFKWLVSSAIMYSEE